MCNVCVPACVRARVGLLGIFCGVSVILSAFDRLKTHREYDVPTRKEKPANCSGRITIALYSGCHTKHMRARREQYAQFRKC